MFKRFIERVFRVKRVNVNVHVHAPEGDRHFDVVSEDAVPAVKPRARSRKKSYPAKPKTGSRKKSKSKAPAKRKKSA